MYRKLILGAFALFIVCTVRAEVFGFNRITSNATNDVANQFFMDVSDIDAGYARVVFTNTGPVTASISEIYFGSHSNSDSPALAISSVAGSDSGVNFTIGNVQPSSPPGVDKSSWFTLAAAQALSPASQNGINAYEYLVMDLSYNGGGLSFTQLLADGQIQVALHIISIDGGESDTLVNNTSVTAIPEPASMILIGSAGSFIAFLRRRFS